MMELLTCDELAKLTKKTTRGVRKDRAAGRLPQPVRIGRSVRWRTTDIQLWIELGCPSRDEFERRLAAEKGGAR